MTLKKVKQTVLLIFNFIEKNDISCGSSIKYDALEKLFSIFAGRPTLRYKKDVLSGERKKLL